MVNVTDRINTPISTQELERRWTAVRTEMAKQKIDVLVMQANNDFMGGYVKYFTDIPATNGYVATVIFPLHERMTVIGQGPFNNVRTFAEDGDLLRRGVGQFMTVPSYASAHFSAAYDGQLAEKALAPYVGGKIGLLGTGAISYALVNTLQKGTHSKSEFIDASELVDQIKAIKSPEEISLIRKTAAMQDAAMQAVFASIKPGMRDLELASIAEHVGHRFGSEQGLFLCASGPIGSVPVFGNRHLQNRVIQEGDQFTILIENSGAGGFYTELGRTCILGEASVAMKEEYEFVIEAQDFTLSLLRPGANSKEIWETYNQFMKDHGRPSESRLHCHGQGYDMVERPLVRFDETMPIAANMVIAAHPTYVTDQTYSWSCDTFLIGETENQRLHQFPRQLIELI
jgi:Xaa-Pro aminopeptidase